MRHCINGVLSGARQGTISRAFLFGVIVAFSGAVSAATLTVPSPYGTIQAALNVAQDGDDILVAPGTYAGNLDFLGKDVWLHSSNGAATTTIDGGGGQRVLLCNSNEPLTAKLEGFTISNGRATVGGGIAIGDSSNLTVLDCVFLSNHSTSTAAQYGGGAIAVDQNGELALTGCTFRLNTAAKYGGAISTFEGVITIDSCLFEQNDSTLNGGAIHANGTSFNSPELTVRNSAFGTVAAPSTGNTAGWGGAMYLGSSGDYLVEDCTFHYNTGSALNLNGGTISITDCTFEDNVHAGNGGAIVNDSADPTITGCAFARNQVTGLTAGGAILNTDGSAPIITSCSFVDNAAANHGGGIYSDGASVPTVTDCTFTGNTAGGYGGAIAHNAADGSYTRCTFESNTADEGGAVSCQSGSGTIFTHCSFIGNQALETDNPGGGGAAYFWSPDPPQLINCLFHGNDSEEDGGAIFLYNTNALITSCTIGGNTASSQSGGLYSGGSSLPVIRNSIIRGNTPSAIVGDVDSEYSDLPSIRGTGDIDSDPRYRDLAAGDLRLGRYTPCADAGNNDAVPLTLTLDLAGAVRFVDDTGVVDSGNGSPPIVDMGAFERQVDSAPITFFVLTGGQIQPAIDEALTGDTVEVEPGTYYEHIDFLGKAIVVESRDGAASTTIHGFGEPSPVVSFVSGEGRETVLRGFTITGADRRLTMDCGGGISIVSASPTVLWCTIDGNLAADGAGICVTDGDPSVRQCTIVDNQADANGGGVSVTGGELELIDCTIESNHAMGSGGGLYVMSADVVITRGALLTNDAAVDGGGVAIEDGSLHATAVLFEQNSTAFNGAGVSSRFADCRFDACTFDDNRADSFGGGIGAIEGTLVVYHSSFIDNVADDSGIDAATGGGVYTAETTVELVNCMFVGNTAWSGAAVALDGGGLGADPFIVNSTFTENAPVDTAGGVVDLITTDAFITNSILWDELAVHEIVESVGTATVMYSDIRNGWPDESNISLNPLFVNPATRDLHLSELSPCIDAGDSTAVPVELTLDVDGEARIADDVNTVDTGVPDPEGAVVDMGIDELESPCLADIDGDGWVGFPDLLIVLASWGPCPSPPDPCPADLNGNSSVDFPDLLIVLSEWGPCP